MVDFRLRFPFPLFAIAAVWLLFLCRKTGIYLLTVLSQVLVALP